MPPAQNTVVMFQLRDDPRAAKRQARTLLVVYAAAVAPLVDAADRDAVDAAYVAALSALFNFVDSEASTAGLKGAGEDLEAARRKLDALEPGFLDAQDRNANFVSATLKAQLAKSSAGAKKMDAAAAYLAAKKAKAGS